jgi:ribonuclease E
MEEPENGRAGSGPPTSAAPDAAAPVAPRRERARTGDGPAPDGRPDGALSRGGDGAQDAVTSPPTSRPRIGDTRPAPAVQRPPAGAVPPAARPAHAAAAPAEEETDGPLDGDGEGDARAPSRRARRRRGARARGRSTGRYLICVHVQPGLSQIAVLEGRALVQHFVSRAADETSQIDGNIYVGRVQNVLPGMEAAFVDIGIPKNAVLYRGDVRYDTDDVDAGTAKGPGPRIEEVLRPGQLILCQVTKNPIGAKGARLTQEVSLPGRFAVFVPNSDAVGISKRLGDNERRRLRKIVDSVRPPGHGLIVRTAAEGASEEELRRDVNGLLGRWGSIERAAATFGGPGLLYREPELAVRILREELNSEYRGVIIDDAALYDEVRVYVESVNPELVERVELYDPEAEGQPLFDRFHVHEQLHKALDRKVWLPSGGSLIIERTEALTVIDVNTGKNVGKSNLEETVFRNNLEAAEEVARQLRLRDIGGIIVIDFIDMEVRENRDKVAAALRAALARDKTRTQVFDISELGLVEMTRKRISEGLIESLSTECQVCHGRGIVLDASAL